jgi:hypothetical protein
VIGLAIRGYLDKPGAWNMAARVPGGKVEMACNNEDRRHYIAILRNGANRYIPVSVAGLDSLGLLIRLECVMTIPMRIIPIMKPVLSKL